MVQQRGLKMEVILKGQEQFYEQPGSPEYLYDYRGVSCTRTFKGPIDVIKSMASGMFKSLLVSGLNLKTVRVFTLESGAVGQLVATLDNYKDEMNLSTTSSVESLEVEWAQLEKPLGANTKFKDVDFKKVESVTKGDIAESELSGDDKKYYDKIKSGVTSYLVFAPVIRKVTKTTTRPTTSTAGKISSPPIGVGNFQYLKTADSATKGVGEFFWTRREEWTGADAWDSDLYQ